MPISVERSCWEQLEKISQLVGQIHGMAFGCKRWNVPAMQTLDTELDTLMKSTFCRPASVEVGSKAYSPLLDMLIINQLTLDSFGELSSGNFDELDQEEVTRLAANDVVGELESYWLTALLNIHMWYAENLDTPTNGQSDTQPIPQAVR